MNHKISNEELLNAIHQEENAEKKDALITQLYNQNSGFWHHAVRHYRNVPKHELDDLYSCVRIAFVKAVNAYNEEKNNLFITFVAVCIQNEINMYYRVNKRHKDIMHLEDQVLSNDRGETLYLIDMVEDPNPSPIVNAEDRIMLEKIIAYAEHALTPKELEMFKNSIAPDPLTCTEMGRKLGTSQSYASRMLTSARQKIANHFLKGSDRPQNFGYTKDVGA